MRRTLRQNPDRVIVGEVLGPEVIDMLNAMGQGNDGVDGDHPRPLRPGRVRTASPPTRSSRPSSCPHEASFQLVAGGLDYVVFISRHPKTGKRRLDSILEVNGFDETVQACEIFSAGPVGSAGWTGTMPAHIDRLAAAGWQPPGAGQGGW